MRCTQPNQPQHRTNTMNNIHFLKVMTNAHETSELLTEIFLPHSITEILNKNMNEPAKPLADCLLIDGTLYKLPLVHQGFFLICEEIDRSTDTHRTNTTRPYTIMTPEMLSMHRARSPDNGLRLHAVAMISPDGLLAFNPGKIIANTHNTK